MKSSSSCGRARGTNGLKGGQDTKDLSKRFAELSGKRGVRRQIVQVAIVTERDQDEVLIRILENSQTFREILHRNLKVAVKQAVDQSMTEWESILGLHPLESSSPASEGANDGQ